MGILRLYLRINEHVFWLWHPQDLLQRDETVKKENFVIFKFFKQSKRNKP